MAKQVTNEEVQPQGRPPVYPWHLWLDGRTWKIVQGVDFTCQMESMENLLRRTAASYAMRVSISRPERDQPYFIIQAKDKEENGEKTE